MIYKNLPDDELLNECRNGNLKAFDALFERYFSKLNQFALKYIKQQSIAEELIMDLMLKVWEKKDTFHENCTLGPYLFKSLKNKIIDHLRKKQLQTVPITLVEETNFAKDTTNEVISYNELQKVYLNHLNQLSPQRKLVFELSRHNNMSHKQIAVSLNLSIRTVENHISAALLFLREKINRYSNLVVAAFMFLFF